MTSIFDAARAAKTSAVTSSTGMGVLPTCHHNVRYTPFITVAARNIEHFRRLNVGDPRRRNDAITL
jgi:hypothetical protein